MWPYRDWVVRAFHENLPFDPMRMFFGGFKEYIALKP